MSGTPNTIISVKLVTSKHASSRLSEKHELHMAAERGSIHAEAEHHLREREQKHEHAREELSKTLVLMAGVQRSKRSTPSCLACMRICHLR